MVRFSSYDAEGKGLKYFLKDSLRNRPVTLLFIPLYLVFVPGFLITFYLRQDKKYESISRFRERLIVYRDDDPKVRNIIKYDENGNRIYLEPKSR